MTRAARQTQIRLEGEIEKLLEGESAVLYQCGRDCVFCKSYRIYRAVIPCGHCPLYHGNGLRVCNSTSGEYLPIHRAMVDCSPDAIPGALAIYMWLEEL